jgi:PAS domain S-box-containing protein
MQSAVIPENETARLAALRASTLLNTLPEPRFDRLTRLVQQALHTPIVLISLLDEERQWFKSRQGLDVCETARAISFCGHAILGEGVFQITDALADPRFADNPLVTAAPFIRFYAGVPLKVAAQPIGTLCIIDSEPRTLSDAETAMLVGFAELVEQEITDRLHEQELNASRDQYRALVNNSPGITYRCKADSDWTMLYISGSIAPLSGYPATDFINNQVRSYASVILAEDRGRLRNMLEQAIVERRSWHVQYRITHRDGSVRWVEERGTPEFSEQGELRYLDGFILDINAEKQLKRKLISLTAQLPGVVYQYQQWPDGRAAFPYASAAIEQIYGVKPEEVTADASKVFAVIHPEDMPAIVNSIQQSMSTLSLWRSEYRVVNKQGAILWLLGSATPEKMPDGSVLWHGYIQDVTTTKQHYLALENANQALQVARERLDAASEQAQMGFWQASLKTGVLWWSPVIYRIFGFDEANTVPSVALFKSTIHPDDRQKVAKSEQLAAQTGVHNVIHRIIRPDGTIRWVHETARMLPEAENPEQILVGSVQDITERIKLQQLKDEFISTVSHELRTPLTVIKGAVTLLNSGMLGELAAPAQKLLSAAQHNSERLSYLINDLLDIEKLVAGKMPFSFQRLNVAKELEQATQALMPFAEQYGVTLQLEPVLSALHVWADVLRLQQTLTNLLSNAIKFSTPGSKVLLRALQHDSMIRFEVQDSGQGIPEEFRTQIFERFAQAKTQQGESKGGTGLGLAICKELVEQMSGSIGFSSSPGQGTTFYFQLPITGSEK